MQVSAEIDISYNDLLLGMVLDKKKGKISRSVNFDVSTSLRRANDYQSISMQYLIKLTNLLK